MQVQTQDRFENQIPTITFLFCEKDSKLCHNLVSQYKNKTKEQLQTKRRIKDQYFTQPIRSPFLSRIRNPHSLHWNTSLRFKMFSCPQSSKPNDSVTQIKQTIDKKKAIFNYKININLPMIQQFLGFNIPNHKITIFYRETKHIVLSFNFKQNILS